MMAMPRPCRVQWVTRTRDMSGVVERLERSGGMLVARSSYDLATEDLDIIDDSEIGNLGIAEFEIDPVELARQVVATCSGLDADETLLIDLTGSRPKVQVLPVPGEHGVIVRRLDGLRRMPRSSAAFGRHDTTWLAEQLTPQGRGAR